MQSPLPDLSALEAGIIEDPMPSRLSRVQENVRELLRNSRIGVAPSLPSPSAVEDLNRMNTIPTPASSPNDPIAGRERDMLPSPSTENVSSAAASPATPAAQAAAHPIPTSYYQQPVQGTTHQSAWFNSRAIAALNHPDLSDPSLEASLKKAEHRKRHSWKRTRRVRGRSHLVRRQQSSWFFCVLTALLLAAIVATYVVLASTSDDVTPTFHLLFVLAILLAGAVCAYAVGRLALSSRDAQVPRAPNTPPPRRRKHRHRTHGQSRHHRSRATVGFATESSTFVPILPIQVRMPGNEAEVRPDSREARPTSVIRIADQTTQWNQPVESVANPPPAYGRWRGSVRADPALLHWRPVQSPMQPTTPDLPSPTYEEAVGEGATQPPSYVTRNSPARDLPAQEALLEPRRYHPPTVSAVSHPEPEMFEVRGVGVAL